ncbi:MAG: BamA/TamA family outer membrane protein [Gemmatimonadetes bacterium]|nr:BamA/TamA family outer membrane protein [Gemmatimonadota bacterium]
MAGALALACPLAAVAQGRTQVRCAGQVITDVVVRTEAPSFGASMDRLPWLGRAVTHVHRTTSAGVIRALLVLKPGDRCTPLRRSESERLLLAMPFIADASVTAYPDGAGVRIEVITVDEPQVVLDAGIKGVSPFVSRFTLGSANLLGNAVYASGQWRDGGFYRDVFAGRYTNYQLFAKPYQLDLRGGRRELGYDWSGQVAFPFLTDVQRVAWRLSTGGSQEYTRFFRGGERPASIPVRREFMEGSVIGRIGPSARMGLIGTQFSVEDVEPGQTPVVITPGGIVADTTTALMGRYAPFRSVRLNALLGFRRVRFRRVTGFDALNAPQDLRTGVQLSSTIGRSLPTSRGASRGESYVGSELYAGIAGARTFAAIDADVEARRSDTGEWNDLVTNGRAAGYLRPHPRHLVTVDLSWSAVRDSRTPVQLTFADRRGGLRGYHRSWLGGGSRVIARAEERWRIANIRGAAAVGVAAFVDAGIIESDGSPLGTSSGWRQSVGLSLIAAAPARSQRMYRVDFALPTNRRDGARFELRLTSEDRTQQFWRLPNDIRSARERVLPQSVFRWP